MVNPFFHTRKKTTLAERSRAVTAIGKGSHPYGKGNRVNENKYTILKGPLPVNSLKHKLDIGVSNIDKILHVCAALCNLSNSVV